MQSSLSNWVWIAIVTLGSLLGGCGEVEPTLDAQDCGRCGNACSGERAGGACQTSACTADTSWELHRGNNGHGNVYSYVRATNLGPVGVIPRVPALRPRGLPAGRLVRGGLPAGCAEGDRCRSG